MWIVVVIRRHIAITKPEHPHIDIGIIHIGQALIYRSSITGHILLHGCDLVAPFSQGYEDRLSMFFEIFVCRGEIDGAISWWHGVVVFQKPVSFVRSIWPIWPETPDKFKSHKDRGRVGKGLVGCP